MFQKYIFPKVNYVSDTLQSITNSGIKITILKCLLWIRKQNRTPKKQPRRQAVAQG